MTRGDPHMSAKEVAEALAEIDRDPSKREAHAARLAWRPAWAIRSRQGAWRSFLSLFKPEDKGERCHAKTKRSAK